MVGMRNVHFRVLFPLSALALLLACSSSDSAEAPTVGASCEVANAGSCDGPKKMLSCQNGKYEAEPCNGAHGCVQVGGKATCDQTVANAGDSCFLTPEQEAAGGACSLDGTKLLKCVNKTWGQAIDCAGPNKCRVDGPNARCDQTQGVFDTPCLVDGAYACAVDGSALLKCTGGKFAMDEDCAGTSTTCKITEAGAACS